VSFKVFDPAFFDKDFDVFLPSYNKTNEIGKHDLIKIDAEKIKQYVKPVLIVNHHVNGSYGET